MPRARLLLPVLALLLPLAVPAGADEAKGPALASDEEAAAALATFQEEFKAKGLKGDDRTSQRDWAMSKLVKVQHPEVVSALAEVTRHSDATLRTIAVLYLARQQALPGPAGKAVKTALERNKKDLVLVLSALDSVGKLRYLGSREALRDLIKDDNFVVKKAAILAAGQTGDLRLLPDLLKLLGIDTKGDSGGGEVIVQEGYSWEGAEAHVDTGTAGDGDQKAAEAAVKEQLAKNQAAAAAAAGAKGSAPGGTGGRGGGGRSVKELAPHVLKALKLLTGQDFATAKDIVTWLGANKEWLAENLKKVDERAREQGA